NRDIRLYRCIEFPLRWELAEVLMQDVLAADTMLFQKDGRWWMLTNIDKTGTNDLCSQLFIFSSDSPISKNWKPHRMNPVFVDARRARNAGLVTDGNWYYRVCQTQGFDLYGHKALINKIVTLNESNYEESTVCEISPGFLPGVSRTHHVHSN